MIRYTLKCEKDHSFESWFASAEGYDALLAAGHVACAVCGSTGVSKALMAPAVKTDSDKPLSGAANPMEEALAEMRRQVEENSDYVGMSFAAEARAMHDGDKPQRSIYGEAKFDEARALIEDGIPVAPLPFAPRRKTN